MAVPFKRLGRHDCRIVDHRNDPAPPDPATVEHVKGLTDHTAVQEPHERIDAENVEAVVGQGAVADGLGELRP